MNNVNILIIMWVSAIYIKFFYLFLCIYMYIYYTIYTHTKYKQPSNLTYTNQINRAINISVYLCKLRFKKYIKRLWNSICDTIYIYTLHSTHTAYYKEERYNIYSIFHLYIFLLYTKCLCISIGNYVIRYISIFYPLSMNPHTNTYLCA